MRIGVTGAFGFLGANFVARLLAEQDPGTRLTAFYSRTRENPLFDPARVTAVPLDVRSAADVREKTRGLDALAHFAGSVTYARRERRAAWDVNVLGARNVFEAVLENRIGRLLYISSINVLGAPVSAGGPGGQAAPADETNDVYDPRAGNPNSFRSAAEALAAVRASLEGDYRFLRGVRVAYFDSKLAAYELAREYRRERGLPVVTVLPGTAVGAGDVHHDISELVERVFTNRLAATFRGGTSFVDAGDVARGALLALRRGEDGEAYIISGRDEDNLGYRQFMQAVAAVARAQGRAVRAQFAVVPPWAALPAAALLEALSPSSALTAALALSGSMCHRFTSRRAEARLGYVPQRTLAQGIADCHAFSELLRARR